MHQRRRDARPPLSPNPTQASPVPTQSAPTSPVELIKDLLADLEARKAHAESEQLRAQVVSMQAAEEAKRLEGVVGGMGESIQQTRAMLTAMEAAVTQHPAPSKPDEAAAS